MHGTHTGRDAQSWKTVHDRTESSRQEVTAHPEQRHDNGGCDGPADDAGAVCSAIGLAGQGVQRTAHSQQKVPQQVEELQGPPGASQLWVMQGRGGACTPTCMHACMGVLQSRGPHREANGSSSQRICSQAARKHLVRDQHSLRKGDRKIHINVYSIRVGPFTARCAT